MEPAMLFVVAAFVALLVAASGYSRTRKRCPHCRTANAKAASACRRCGREIGPAEG